MSTFGKIAILFCVAAGSFIAGVWFSRTKENGEAAPGVRRVLYYHDPMHPAYKSDKPGIAPDCGMQLEPVYADGGPAAGAGHEKVPSTPGTVQISADQQQVIGVRVAEVDRTAARPPVRVPGRVATDETKVYRVSAATDGWVRTIEPITTGSVVKKNETLGAFTNVELFGAQRMYVFALMSMDRFQASGKESAAQVEQASTTIQQARLSLRNLGMSESQIEEIAKTRQSSEDIRITSPEAGFIISRNIYSGQKFERGTEFFRIADLSHVWVLADLFEKDASFVHFLSDATVRYQGRSFSARISNIPPQFDAGSRALRIRLELDNPQYVLRPDMFVDVEFKVSLPQAIAVPASAVLDTGRKKTVFVDRGHGVFEPRPVETGWRFGDRVQIVKGLEAGERIVVSGNFLIDSESRMQLAAFGAAEKKAEKTQAKDPVCGMEIDPGKAARKSEYHGRTHYFCNEECKKTFDKNPAKYAGRKA